jgi:hypothetical protein
MHLMIPGAGSTVEAFCQDPVFRPHLGFMVTPNTGNSIQRLCSWGIPWCADNAAFNHSRFDSGRFLAMCRKIQKAPTPPVFVTVPDQVGSHECSSYLFEGWLRYLDALGFDLPWAFVLQNGIESPEDVPWDFIQAVFIGGDDDFKEDTLVTCELIPEARRRGKWVHMGRVNGRRRLRLALLADVDSVDGSSLARFSRTWIPKFVADLWSLEAERDRLDALIARQEREIEELDSHISLLRKESA